MIGGVSEHAEISTLSTTLEELTKRVTALADAAADVQNDELATELFGIERALSGALRRLRRLSGPSSAMR
jgi:hypothetical protein